MQTRTKGLSLNGFESNGNFLSWQKMMSVTLACVFWRRGYTVFMPGQELTIMHGWARNLFS